MEYDNDRVIKGTQTSEWICWLFFGLFAPIVNGLGSFPYQKTVWLALLGISLSTLPVYIAYSRLLVPKFLIEGRKKTFGVLTVFFFFLMQGWIFVLFQAARVLFESQTSYFVYRGMAVARESVWMVINILLCVSIAFLRKSLDKKDKIKWLEKENMYYKLRYFRTQLNPHFLFNTLNSIYSLSLSKSGKTPDVIIRLSDIMRFLMYECTEDKIPLNKEIEFIRNYIEIEKIRYDADIRFTVEGVTENILIEPFLFISFIENGFKHAIDHSFATPFIYITLKVSPEQIALNVINNTSLELEAQAKRVQGKSLVNSKSILEMLYPNSHALDIIQVEKKDRKESKSRFRNAQERLQRLYPDTHTLDVILNNNTFTVSLILTGLLDKMHYNRG